MRKRYARTAGFDETKLRVGKRGHWLHVSDTPILTLYWVDEKWPFEGPKRGQEAHERMGVLPEFKGIAVHDRYESYSQWKECTHAFCNAHILRDLTGIEETTGQAWTGELKTVLVETKQAVDLAKVNGLTQLDPEDLQAVEARYDMWVRRGLQSNPKAIQEPGQSGRPRAKWPSEGPSPARKWPFEGPNLAEALRDHKDKFLLFARDFNVPFDNPPKGAFRNLAERDLRMRNAPFGGMKVKQKISGGFRSIEGAHAFATVRGYISTARKRHAPFGGQGKRALDALRAVFDRRDLDLKFAE